MKSQNSSQLSVWNHDPCIKLGWCRLAHTRKDTEQLVNTLEKIHSFRAITCRYRPWGLGGQVYTSSGSSGIARCACPYSGCGRHSPTAPIRILSWNAANSAPSCSVIATFFHGFGSLVEKPWKCEACTDSRQLHDSPGRAPASTSLDKPRYHPWQTKRRVVEHYTALGW